MCSVNARFADRIEAGALLAARLSRSGYAAPVVLGLPRGGVPVAAEVARTLGGELDVFVVRKLGLPAQPELAFGAVAGAGVRVLNPDVVATARLDAATIERLTDEAGAEVGRRERAYRGARPRLPLRGRVVILVDDGIATGATVRAAIAAVRADAPATVVVATPVAPAYVVRELAAVADDVAVLIAAQRFRSVGSFYANFDQLSDAEVQAVLARYAG
jgi:putative phosphoribosyl transferase